ncbi:MAG: FkbM family methyltransferase [Thermoguttaceae bacterium]
MRPWTFVELLGGRFKTRRYGYSVQVFDLPGIGTVRYAQWKHPRVRPRALRVEDVEQYRRFISAGDFCIDVGAHAGDSTLPMALAAGPSGVTLALEPNPFVYPVLEKNSRLNRTLATILPMLAAAMEQEGEIVFEYSDAGYCNGGCHGDIGVLKHGHTYPLSVHGINLSHELRHDFPDLLPKLKFIKIDAEGYDLHVIRSIADLIEEFRPYVKAEVFKGTSPAYRRELVSFFLERSYVPHRVAVEPCLAGEVLGPDDMMQWDHYDILCLPQSALMKT